eukprot:15474256-Alexandrium_andersonii.AAC.2
MSAGGGLRCDAASSACLNGARTARTARTGRGHLIVENGTGLAVLRSRGWGKADALRTCLRDAEGYRRVFKNPGQKMSSRALCMRNTCCQDPAYTNFVSTEPRVHEIRVNLCRWVLVRTKFVTTGPRAHELRVHETPLMSNVCTRPRRHELLMHKASSK